MALYPEGTSPLPMDDVQRAANKSNELSRQTLGLGGSTVLSASGTASDGPFVAIQILKDIKIRFKKFTNLENKRCLVMVHKTFENE